MTQEQQKSLQVIEANFRNAVKLGGWEVENVVHTFKAIKDLVDSLQSKEEPTMEVASADHIGDTPRTPKG